MKRLTTLALAVAALAVPTAAQGAHHHPASAPRAHRADTYHHALALRHRIRVLRAAERAQLRRLGIRPPARYKPLSWRPGRLSRGAAWHSLRLRGLRRRPTPVRVVAVRSGSIPAIIVAATGDAGMVGVARCESGLNPSATNGQYLGLFQLGGYARGRYLRGDWRDPWANARAAAAYKRAAGGLGPWSCGWAYGR